MARRIIIIPVYIFVLLINMHDQCLLDAWLLFGNNSEVKSTNQSKHKVPPKINMRCTKVNILCHISVGS